MRNGTEESRTNELINRAESMETPTDQLQTIGQGSKTLICILFTKTEHRSSLQRVCLNFPEYSLTRHKANLQEESILLAYIPISGITVTWVVSMETNVVDKGHHLRSFIKPSQFRITHGQSNSLRLLTYIYRDISNIVATETRESLVQHIWSPGNIKTMRFSLVSGSFCAILSSLRT
ncbi:hypothetical protein T265_00317 [Opisthorchis viverrini]|uniref:Uncharacterized protein n=1 Tax=Opisthorchis viverrini TaxID=6198 RepID=A0A075A2C1_OPIVI|nr:hypothetical protein T265_00317 [Opisthorchis viverrini]KER33873.1 hypothetical protein T265_00317 [Opisthorchis viverrini]